MAQHPHDYLAISRRGASEVLHAPKYGAGERNRTSDLRITNAPLYQLSYPGKLANPHNQQWGAIRAAEF